MNELKIEIDQDRTSFEPEEEITGTVSWSLDSSPRDIELRLFWFTRGKGTEDAGVVERVRFEQPHADERRSFRLRLPDAPYSFSGKLISLVWGLELVAHPAKVVARRELVIAPGAQEVRLDSLPDRTPFKRLFGLGRS